MPRWGYLSLWRPTPHTPPCLSTHKDCHGRYVGQRVFQKKSSIRVFGHEFYELLYGSSGSPLTVGHESLLQRPVGDE